VQVLLSYGVAEGCDEDLVDAVDGGGGEVLAAALPDGAAAGLLAAAFLVLGAALAGGLQSGDEAAYVGDAEFVEVDAAESWNEVDVYGGAEKFEGGGAYAGCFDLGEPPGEVVGEGGDVRAGGQAFAADGGLFGELGEGVATLIRRRVPPGART
jgi:hypothetical protein